MTVVTGKDGGQTMIAAEVERCVLVGLDREGDSIPIGDSLDELARLAESAGAEVVERLVQAREAPDPGTYLGRGKLEELAAVCRELGAGLVIFDDELTPAQARNIEREVDVRVVDRTQLILDIFAQRARTREGKIQVELAQLRYTLPRLGGLGESMSRLGGGIGTRGPGETKLEVDRRRIRSRMAELRRELEDVRRMRALHRKGREGALAFVTAFVGYTNAGKSTLFNRLTGADAYADDRLFATLDPTVRNVELPRGKRTLFVDTVGFIRKLPHDLVAAFRATLEEVVEADVLLHVVDVSREDWYDQARAVFDVLAELGAADKPVVTAFNKVDLVDRRRVEGLVERTPHSVAVSAVTSEGIGRLLQVVEQAGPEPSVQWRFLIPYPEAKVVSWIHRHGRVMEETYAPEGVRLLAELSRRLAARVESFRDE